VISAEILSLIRLSFRSNLSVALRRHSGALVDKVLAEAADAFPEVEGMNPEAAWKRTMALVECLMSDDAPPANVTVIVDASDAAPTNGEAGIVLEPGSNVGRETLQAILCNAVNEVTARDGVGRYMDYRRRQRTAPPALKRVLLAEAGFTCSGDGCASRRRLQIHHVTPWAKGGETNQLDLVVLCLVPSPCRRPPAWAIDHNRQ
jgi:hypothetical protein